MLDGIFGRIYAVAIKYFTHILCYFLNDPFIAYLYKRYSEICKIIKAGAFKGNKKLKKVVIPNTVTKIGSNAFKGCKNLKKVTINANPNLKIGSGAFKKINKKALIVVKGVKGNQKGKILKAIKKQTNAKVK